VPEASVGAWKEGMVGSICGAGNTVDLDSNPMKLIEIGKQLLITRGVADHVLDRQRRRHILRDPPQDLASTDATTRGGQSPRTLSTS
jgi:hypothetical protein